LLCQMSLLLSSKFPQCVPHLPLIPHAFLGFISYTLPNVHYVVLMVFTHALFFPIAAHLIHLQCQFSYSIWDFKGKWTRRWIHILRGVQSLEDCFLGSHQSLETLFFVMGQMYIAETMV
jgi:hypothetical protein